MSGLAAQFDWGGIVGFCLRIFAVLLCITIHEVSHGFAAYKLGDPTAKSMHRLSLNPIHHIDPFGLLMMVLVGFGWAKPVPVDARYFKNPKSGMAITAFAGPLSNFVAAFLTALLLGALTAVTMVEGITPWMRSLMEFLSIFLSLNVGLGIFNLIPFPPLDGSKILGFILPEETYFRWMRYERYGMLILMAILWFGLLDKPLYLARNFVIDLFTQCGLVVLKALLPLVS